MKKMTLLSSAFALGLAGASTALAQTGGPVEVGDLAVGLSRSNGTESALLVRGAARIGNWDEPFLQSVEFDNTCGPHTGEGGNLLGLTFGTTLGGGTLHNLATDGSLTDQLLWEFDGSNVVRTRTGGLSVSPDNDKIALFGYDTGSLIIMDYTPGNGDGTGASVSNPIEVPFAGVPGATQGTTWYKDNQGNQFVLVHRIGLSIETAEITRYDETGDLVDTLAVFDVRGTGSVFTDIDYDPAVSPYVYGSYSSFEGSTFNTLVAYNPGNGDFFSIDFDTSANTAREIAIGPDGLLYIGQFGGGTGPTIDTINLNPTTWVDNGTTDYIFISGLSSSFNGLDVARNVCGGSAFELSFTGACPGQVTLTVTGATANGNVAFVYGFGNGPTTIPSSFPCAGTILNVGNPNLDNRTARADANGVATLRVNVPASACGRVKVQVLDVTTCNTSNVVTVN